jgi:hypothetical protein
MEWEVRKPRLYPLSCRFEGIWTEAVRITRAKTGGTVLARERGHASYNKLVQRRINIDVDITWHLSSCFFGHPS